MNSGLTMASQIASGGALTKIWYIWSVVQASFYPSYRFRAKGTQDGRSVQFDGGVIGFSSFRSTGDLSGDEVKIDLTNR